MNIITDCIRSDAEYAQLLETVKSCYRDKPLPVLVSGVCEGASDALTLSLAEDTCETVGGCIIIVCPEERECRSLCELLNSNGLPSAFFTVRDFSFYDITASHDYEHERLQVLSGIIGGAYKAVVTTPDAMLGFTIPPEILEENTVLIDSDTEISPQELSDRLIRAGYARVDMVDGMGQFAMRGGIIDIFAPFGHFVDEDGESHEGAHALRIELFGDSIDRMGLFDTDTQRITLTVWEASLPPARELIIDSEVRERLKTAVKYHQKLQKDQKIKDNLTHELTIIDGGGEINFADKYISVVYPEKCSLIDYFGGKTEVIVRNGSRVYERLKGAELRDNESIKSFIEEGIICSKYAEFSKPVAEFDRFLDKNTVVHVNSLSFSLVGKRTAGIFGFRTKSTVSYAENFQLLAEDLDGYMRGGYRAIVTAENETAAQNLCEMLCEADFKAKTVGDSGVYKASDMKPGTVTVMTDIGIQGYELVAPKIAFLSTCSAGLGGSLRTANRKSGKSKNKNLTKAVVSWEEFRVGDLVVHETYGIGRYTGIENVTSLGVSRDYIGIQYAGTNKLFLPVEQLDKVTKYIGPHAEDGTVKLSHFGGGDWTKAKSRVKAAVKEMAKELIKLYAERARKPGIQYPPDDRMQQDFDASFEYDETDSQLDAINDIKQDMMLPMPMDRLLCGDVGYGKTEVALRAAFKAVLGGKQVAILVPTTLLALQHYQTALSRMRSFAVSVDMVSRFRTPKQQEQTLRRLERGDLDILIGTHRILSKDIKFKNLGLLIVDEEQRFGVAQKEKLKQLAGNIDVLTLTATPIPRTLNMAMSGIRDISVLDEAPGNRLPVQTYVLEHDDMIVNEAIRRELRRGGQIFYLFNDVENIDTVAARLTNAIPDAKITVAHGKMDKDMLEEIWEDMLEGKIDILVCTTIIETGVDIPNANTLIVENSHRLGLSQLHQIRGRIGRSSRRAYAYFTYPKNMAISEIAQKRLEAIREYAEFGAGFKIAMRDMEIRGAGNILGAEQHGHMDAIGYDLYIKLLNQAVLEEKGELPQEKPECVISINVNAFIPEYYVKYPAQRMALYRRIALIETEYDRQDIADEMLDRFGEIPPQADALLTIALIRANAVKCGIKQIKQDGTDISIFPEKFDYDLLSRLSKAFDGRVKMSFSGEARVLFRLKPNDSMPGILNSFFAKYVEMGISGK